MIRIDLKTSGLKQLANAAKSLGGIEKQAKFAATVAITRTASLIKTALVEEMKQKFDRPTPTTLNSIMMKPATKTNPEAVVWLKDREMGGKQSLSMAQIIGHQFKGGSRNIKRLEMRLSRLGILPAGMYVAPGRGARLDQYGNLHRGDVTAMLTQLGAFVEPGIRSMSDRTHSKLRKKGTLAATGSGRGMRVKRSEYIVKQPLGIWKVIAKGRVEPVLAFIRKPNYTKRIEWEKVAARVANKNLIPEFNKAFKQAMASSGYRGKWK
ncbi:MAG: hypothetical protein IPP59_08045 [Betaproteobacteria bacterium]|jgi:hypothetical protein|nr:hypothetical protein [Betaproteobacteria bacterium]MBK9784122.1 hypothetical protein [Candidatus Dechloromonas phosphorivorans]